MSEGSITTADPVQPAVADQPTMDCVACGQPIDASLDICPRCGVGQPTPVLGMVVSSPPLSIRSVVGRVLDTYGEAWRLILAISLAPAIGGLFSAINPVLGLLLVGITGFFAGAALIAAVDDVWTGGRADALAAYRSAIGRAVPLFLCLLVIGLAAGAAGALAVVAVAAGAALVSSGVAAVGAVVAAVGALAAVVGLYALLLRWSLASPVIVLEGRGPIDGIRRSWTLTARRVWKIFGIFIVLGALVSVPTVGVNFLSTYAPPPWAAIGWFVVYLGFTALVPTGYTLVMADLSGRRYAASLSAQAHSRTGADGPTALEVEAASVVAVGPDETTRPRRRTAGSILGAVALVTLTAGVAAVVATGGLPYDPDRGRVLFTTTSPSGSCQLAARGTDFSTSDTIWVVAILNHRIPAGEPLTVEGRLDGAVTGTSDMAVPDGSFECLSFGQLSGMSPGAWTITVSHGSTVEATGTMRVR